MPNVFEFGLGILRLMLIENLFLGEPNNTVGRSPGLTYSEVNLLSRNVERVG